MRATPPRTVPLTVRDARRRERRHAAAQWALVFVAVFAVTALGLWGSWDRQPLGERRSAAQEAQER